MVEPLPPPLRWDVFCRVIDNHGDLGVCWRLACDLADRGQQVRLWVDDASALEWMAPAGHAGVERIDWTAAPPALAPADVVVEAFGCDPPADFVARMAARPRPPVWINLEYLSAETYVERSHRLASPQNSGPGRGLVKWFFYPGFTPATGGLLREPGLIDRLASLDSQTALASLGVQRRPSERCVSVFCYPGVPLTALLSSLREVPTLLLTTPGAATEALQDQTLPRGLRNHALPWLSQAAYDRLLRACDLNLVRGEDSFVRAQWAGRPMLWQIYPQHDGVHAAKLEAFLARHLADAPASLGRAVRAWMQAWNGLGATPPDRLPDLVEWQSHAERWRDALLVQADLVSQLLDFVIEKR